MGVDLTGVERFRTARVDNDEPSVEVERLRFRLGLTMVAANLVGGVVVFVLLTFVLPAPPHLKHVDTVRVLSAILLVCSSAVVFPLMWVRSSHRWKAATGWALAGRRPTDEERDRTLLMPLTQQRMIAVVWVLAAIVFAVVNAPVSVEVAGNVAVTVLLGGLVTCALGYLLAERLLRPITALALADEVPARPRLPGVQARTLLSWALGSGVLLLGIALLGIGGLYESRFTRVHLSIAVLVLSAIGLVVGFAMMLGLAQSLADRIEALRHSAAAVARGDLDQHVTVDDGSELGLLQAGFNQMVDGLRERERLRDLFGRQVGEDVVRHALETGVKLGGEARDAAVLFVDLQGSTALAQSHDPAEVVSMLNEFFAIVVEVVAAEQGWVNKFEGDAALCVFGAPLPDPDGAAHALAAARSLDRRLSTELPGVRAGIGVSAGRVVAGNVGAAERFEYTVIGDPVNEAARLSELAKRGSERALASDAALSLAGSRERALWRSCDEVTLRGRSEPTAVSAPAVSTPARPAARDR